MSVALLTVLTGLASCRPPDQHFRGPVVEIEGDILGRYWLTRQLESVVDLPAPPLNECGDGYVVVRFVIDSLGNVFESSVLRADPQNCYEQAALKLVSQWTFVPAPTNRKRAPVRVTQRIPFSTD